MPQLTLKLKVVLYVMGALSLAMVLFIGLVTWHLRQEIFGRAADHVTQLSEVITKSTRYAMLQNQPEYVARIIHDVARQEGIDRVRILSKEGRIIHSTYAPEIGQTLDRKAEACWHCHQSERPLEQVPRSGRTWTFTGADGRRLLGSMEVIRNEPGCYNAACHKHRKETSVLGVLDIVYSLEEVDRRMFASMLTVAGIAFCFIVVAALAVGFFVHRLVYVPLRDLDAGARRLAAGRLDHEIPVRSEDELGRLATSFNAMTAALGKSRGELEDWGRTLEQKVEERTRKLRMVELEAARREKLASVGLLAAGVAHELNNPLTGILTFSHLVRQSLPEGSQSAEDLDLVIGETKRCSAIIRRLLDFAREQAPEKRFIDLNRIISDTARLIEQPAQLSNIELTMDLDPGLPPVWADEDLVKQVVMNVLVNAQHAIEDRGAIRIRSRLDPEPKSFEAAVPAVPMVEITITDTGCGIPAQNLPRIFDPFFTTKEAGKGTGLGLSVSHGIIKAHGGEIEVESRVGEGSTFRIYLPVKPPSANAAGSSA